MRWPTLAAAAALTASVGGCGYSPDMSAVESDLTDQYRQRVTDPLVTDPTVRCPSEIDWNPGSDFHCAVDTLWKDDYARLTVSMENDQGEFTWVIDQP